MQREQELGAIDNSFKRNEPTAPLFWGAVGRSRVLGCD